MLCQGPWMQPGLSQLLGTSAAPAKPQGWAIRATPIRAPSAQQGGSGAGAASPGKGQGFVTREYKGAGLGGSGGSFWLIFPLFLVPYSPIPS